MATQKQGITKAKITKSSNGMYYGYIYLDGKQLEKLGGKSGYWSQDNCINDTNKRVDFWRNLKGVHIPYISRRLSDATT